MVYFDHNATTPLSPVAREAWLHATGAFPGNPSSPHRVGARAEAALDEAREKLARILGGSAADIVWTSGASESSNMVFHHLAARAGKHAEVWVSAIEHPCVIAAAQHYFSSSFQLIPVTRGGGVDLDWLASRLRAKRPALVALLAANNETGILQPWQQALALCRQRQVSFFCDAVQWIGKLPAAGLGECDFVSGSAHKFGGPKGVGFLKCPRGEPIEPLIRGGPQEDGRRAGTENVAGVLAMLAALQEREAQLVAGGHAQREKWRAEFEGQLVARLTGTDIVGADQPRLWNTVSTIMPPSDCRQRWVVKLDKLGFAASTGSACSSGKEAPSHVLLAMAYSAAEAGRALRFSSGWETTQDQWRQLAEGLAKVHSAMMAAEVRV